MSNDQNDPFLYHEQGETWLREQSVSSRLRTIEQQLSALIADNADLRNLLKYVSERAGIQAKTLEQHNHRLIKLETKD